MSKKRFKYLALGITCFLLGSALLQPAVAHIVQSKNAHTLSNHHAAYYASRAWTKKYFYTKGQADARYLTQSAAASSYYPLSGGTVAGNVTAGNFNFSYNKTRYLTVPPAAFRPNGDLQVDDSNFGLDIYKSSANGYTAMAPVYLPDGAILKSLKFYYADYNTTGILICDFYRATLDSSAYNLIAYVAASTTGAPGDTFGTDTADSQYAVVDNQTYAYYLILDLRDSNIVNLRARSVIITYELPSL